MTTERLINQASAGWTTYGTFFGGESHARHTFDHYLLYLTYVRRIRAAAHRDAGFSTSLRAIIHRSGPGPRTERDGSVVLPQRCLVVDRERRLGIADPRAVPVHGILRAHSRLGEAHRQVVVLRHRRLLRHLPDHQLRDRSSAELLPGLCAPACLWPVEPDVRQMVRR